MILIPRARRACTLLLAIPMTVAAQTPVQPTVAALEAGLSGLWAGTLSYRDYQTDKMVDLPMRAEYRALDDGATVINFATFDDGPKAGAVIVTTVELFNLKLGMVDNVAFRRGRPEDKEVDKVSLAAFTDDLHWTLQFDHDGLDGKVKAHIRSIETRDGNALTIEEEVVPIIGAKKDWKTRNITKLTRIEPKS